MDVELFRSQNVFVMGEVRAPGRYTLTGSVTLVEALAQAGSIAPTAGSEVLILHPKRPADGIADASRQRRRRGAAGQPARHPGRQAVGQRDDPRWRHDLRAEGAAVLRHRLRAQSRAPTTLEPNLTVLQAISLAGGLTDRGSDRRVRIIRNKKEFDAKPTDIVQADDTIVVRQRLM